MSWSDDARGIGVTSSRMSLIFSSEWLWMTFSLVSSLSSASTAEAAIGWRTPEGGVAVREGVIYPDAYVAPS